MRRKLAAGNWKMNGNSASLAEIETLARDHAEGDTDLVICPPATLISRAAAVAGPIGIGGQDCHMAASGAHTGDISASQLRDAGATSVILGHSERREAHEEDSAMVREKARAAHAEDLTTIICVGESLAQRDAQNTLDIIGAQLSLSVPDTATGHNTVIAYEPIWAIGTGKVPSMNEIGQVHDFIRSNLERRFGPGVGRSVRLLYGGSVKPGNAAEIFSVSNVDGALVGGASLKAADFSPIVAALDATA